jgi:hypothetical protein
MLRRVSVASSVIVTAYGGSVLHTWRSSPFESLALKTPKPPSNTAISSQPTSSILYFPLDDKGNQIRVLQLSPAKKSREIRCKLKIVSLDDKPTYTALSYTWGEPIRRSASLWTVRGIYQFFRALFGKYFRSSSPTIFLNEEPFPVTPNCASALKHLRGELSFWVDSICIYLDRYRTKCCRNLRFEPLFCEGVGFVHLACCFLDPEKALTTLRLSPPFTHMSLFRLPWLLRAGSGSYNQDCDRLSHSLVRLERMRSNLGGDIPSCLGRVSAAALRTQNLGELGWGVGGRWVC